jgi:hypothetical protein
VRLSDLTIEVRDKTLTRIGLIRPEDVDLELTDAHNNVGSWRLALASEHPLAGVLRTPGSGIVVTGPRDVLFSGPTVKAQHAADVADPAGTLSIEGVDDTVLLADTLAYPEPGNPDPTTQKRATDERTGPVETLMHAFVNANIGPAAPPARRGFLLDRLTMGPNAGRGPAARKSARFKVLGSLLSELAVLADLGFRIVQRGDRLVFETFAVTDRTKEVRLDIYNNTLAGHRVATTPPGATRVIVAGQQEGVDRQIVPVITEQSAEAERQWGRRIERFVDQRNTDKVEELTQAGLEVLTEEGHTSLAVQAVPMEDTAMPFGTAWNAGDRVAVVVEGQELAATVTGYTLKANRDGFRLGALIGDPAGFDPDAALGKRVATTESRVGALERTAENNAPGARYLDATDFDQDTPAPAYPSGESVFYLGTEQAAAGGWTFTGKRGIVRTIRASPTTGDATQLWQRVHSKDVTPELWMRGGNTAGWAPWQRIASHDDVTAAIANQVPKIISVSNHNLGTIKPGWNIYTVTIAGGRAMPSAAYAVTCHAHELVASYPGNAVLQVAEAYPISATRFYLRINSTWNADLALHVDYVLVQNTP